jgi:hypothetical protein
MTWANDVPLETATNRSAPMAVDQTWTRSGSGSGFTSHPVQTPSALWSSATGGLDWLAGPIAALDLVWRWTL